MESEPSDPVLDMEAPDLDQSSYKHIWVRAYSRAREIAVARLNEATETRRFEWQQFYSAWAGLKFRFRATAEHSRAFAASFQNPGIDLSALKQYEQDEALFGFFVKGLSALECFGYALYALGALVRPAGFPRMDRLASEEDKARNLKGITIERTSEAFEQQFPGSEVVSMLAALTANASSREWREMRNVLAHRVAAAGRNVQYVFPPFLARPDDPLPIVTSWPGDFPLDAGAVASRYSWLAGTVNALLAATKALTDQELPL